MRGLLALVCAFSLLAGCGSSSGPAGTAASGASASGNPDADRLAKIADDYYERWLELNPLEATEQGDHRFDARFGDYASPTWLADSLAAEQDALDQLRAVDPAKLTGEDRVTYDAFRYGREIAIEGYRYPSELLAIHQFSNLATRFATLGSGAGAHPFATRDDYDHFLTRMDGFVAWVDQTIVNLRLGAEKGFVQPKVLIEATLPQLEDLGGGEPRQSVFWRPILTFPAGLSVEDRRRITKAWEQSLSTKVLPAYRRLHGYLQKEYLPKARNTVGFAALPGGDVWYAYLVRLYTTTSMTPSEVHELGLREVARIRGEMERIKAEVDHQGDLRSFLDALRADKRFRYERPEALLEDYGALRDRVDAAVPALFAIRPKAAFEIRPVEDYRAQAAASASYQRGSADGTRPGIFYVNTYDLPSRPKYLMEAIYLHEAVPGHHFQVSIAQEATGLPKFRRFGRVAAFTEGWGLYAETLGPELGLYTDPYSRFGALTLQVWRAARLVVDTGLHSRGWSRDRAIDYLRANTALGDADISAEVNRYIALPGQALAYKVGQLELTELRRRAQQTLGPKFDPRAFHTEILAGGPLPLPVLEQRVDRWIDSRR